MPNLQTYALAYATVDGALLSEEASVVVNRHTGSQAVITVPKGYAGESPGAAMSEVDVVSAVPAIGFEFNAAAKMRALVPAELGVIVGTQVLVVKGFIIADTFKHAANSEATYDFKFRGQFGDWQ